VTKRDVSHDETLAAGTSRAEAAAHTLTQAGKPPSRTTETAGDMPKHLAHFRIERLLGRGGMGDVYLATDMALDRPVAVKVLPRHTTDSPARDRFVREARAQARLAHPNVCHIYFIGEQDGQLFFAMEYVEGETMAERLARTGPVAEQEAVELVRMAALGLRAAADAGFTHRDVKPSNLLIDKHGHVKVVDFGLAIRRDDTSGTDVVGTPLYIAPEQARGEPVDFRADLYSLGATLHHLVGGAPPFQGDTTEAIISCHLTEPRVPLAASPVEDLCARLMAKEPSQRFASYGELLDAIEESRARPPPVWARIFAGIWDAAAVGIGFGLIAFGLSLLGIGLSQIGNAILATLLLLWSALSMRQGTVGKRMLELEIRGLPGQPPPTRRQRLVRAAVQWGPAAYMLAFDFATGGLLAKWADITCDVLTGLAIFYPFVALFWSARKGGRTPWDRIARTRVCYRSQ
jgi:predicted Ser/Thr protein kinase